MVSFAAYTDTVSSVNDPPAFGNKIALFRMPEISCALIRKQAYQFTAFPVIYQLYNYSTCPTPLTETVLSVLESLQSLSNTTQKNYAYILSSNGYQ